MRPSSATGMTFVFSVCRLVSRRCHNIVSIGRASSDMQYYEGSDSWGASPCHPRSPHLLRLTVSSFHRQPRDASESSLSTPPQRDPWVPDFTPMLRARRSTPPNRVRHPTDQGFASGCFPPHLAVTQLPSATEMWLTPTRTCTVLIRRHRGRTT